MDSAWKLNVTNANTHIEWKKRAREKKEHSTEWDGYNVNASKTNFTVCKLSFVQIVYNYINS